MGIIGGLIFLAEQSIMDTLNTFGSWSLTNTLFYAFIIVGFSSEFIKYLIIRIFVYSTRHFKGPFDGILNTLIVSLSFSIVILVFLLIFQNGKAIDQLFLYTYSIASIIFAVILGYFLGLAKTRSNTGFLCKLTAIIAASIFNGIYTFCFFTHDYVLLILLGTISIILATVLFIRSVNLNASTQ